MARRIGVIAAIVVVAACSSNDADKLLTEARDALARRDFATAVIQTKNVLQRDANNGEARVLFAQALLAQRDPIGALDELRKAQTLGYDNEQVVPLVARALNASGQPQKTIDEFAARTLNTPRGQGELATELAQAYLATGKIAQAREQYAKALAAQPDSVNADLGTARLALADGNLPDALAAVEGAIARHPDSIEPMLLRGELLVLLRRVDDGAAQFEQVVQKRPDDPRAYGRLSVLRMGMGRLDDAQKDVTALVKIAPGALQTVYLQSLLALRQGKWTAARDAAARVLRVVPDHLPAQVVAANANIRLGDQLQAQAMLQKVVASRPDWAAPRKLLAESFVAARDADDALATLAPLGAQSPNDPDYLNLIGQAYLLKGDFERSSAAFTKLSSQRPKDAQALANLGFARMGAGDEEAALHDLEAATKLDASRVQFDAAILAAQLRKGQTPAALDTLAALEKRQPDNPLTYNLKGQVMLSLKRTADARTAFERALALQSDNIEAALQLARLDVADKKIDAARQRFRAMVEKEPKNVRAWVLLATVMADTGASVDELRTTLQKAIDADPTRNEARAAMVELLLRSGKPKDAMSIAQQAQAAQPDAPDALGLLGVTQLAAGDPQQAVSTFTRLQDLQPQSPLRLMQLADAQVAAGNNAAAEQSLRRALTLKDDLIDVQRRLVGLMVNAKRYDEALDYVHGLQTASPEAAEPYAFEASVQAGAGRPQAATVAWQNAYKRSASPVIAIGLHEAYVNEGRKSDAEHLVSTWLAAHPRDVAMRTYLGTRAIEEKRYADAMQQYEAVLSITPNSPAALNNLAWAAGQMNDPKTVAYAEAALAAAPRSPEVMETAGTIFVAHGQQQRGLDLLAQAATLAPGSAPIRLGYARALATTGDKHAAQRELRAAADITPTGNTVLRGQIDELAKSL